MLLACIMLLHVVSYNLLQRGSSSMDYRSNSAVKSTELHSLRGIRETSVVVEHTNRCLVYLTTLSIIRDSVQLLGDNK
jgi:hypothetical protein